jgi:DNA polymerase-3 subunit epsilon
MFLFFDTETIRVNNTPRIIQMGWALTDDNGVEFRSQCFIVRPSDFEIPLSAARTRRITTEVARCNGMTIGAVLEFFANDIAAADVLVAHNAHFDKNVIRDELFRAKRDDVFAGEDLYCTMRSSIHFCRIKTRRGHKWPTLEQLHISLFNATFSNMHNALSDARACARCFFELRRRGAVFDPQIYDLTSDKVDAYDYQSFEDQDLFDELETLKEFLGRSQRLWLGRFKAYFRRSHRLSERQRQILSRMRVEAEGRV